jgi:hypothetical protein
MAEATCRTEAPALVGPDAHAVACHHPAVEIARLDPAEPSEAVA